MTDPLRSSKIRRVKSRTAKRLPRLARALCAWLLLAPLAGPASANDYGLPLFQWRDAQGTVRYTTYPDEVPRSQRATLRRVEASISSGWNLETASAVPAAAAGAAAGLPAPGNASEPASETDAAIARLEATIARDKALLESLISDPEGVQTLEDSPDLSAIAERLPRQQADLEALLERRGR